MAVTKLLSMNRPVLEFCFSIYWFIAPFLMKNKSFFPRTQDNVVVPVDKSPGRTHFIRYKFCYICICVLHQKRSPSKSVRTCLGALYENNLIAEALLTTKHNWKIVNWSILKTNNQNYMILKQVLIPKTMRWYWKSSSSDSLQ